VTFRYLMLVMWSPTLALIFRRNLYFTTERNSDIGRVYIYPATATLQSHDVIMLDPAFEDYLRAEIDSGVVEEPLRCFAVTEENLLKHGFTLSKYICYSFGPEIEPLSGEADGGQRELFKTWEHLVAAFNARILERFMVAANDINKVENGFFLNVESLVMILRKFFNLIVSPLLDCSPFCGRDPSRKPQMWFRESVNLMQELSKFITHWERFKKENMLHDGCKLEELVIYARKQINVWQAFQKLDATKKCFAFSAFLFGLSELHYGLRNWVISLICLHRATDLYLQYCALDEGVMKQSVRGLEYSNYCSERVSILNSLQVLEYSGRLVSDDVRYRDFKDLNEDRNRLALTHSVYGIRPEDVSKYLRAVETHITKMEGSSRWAQVRRSWFPLPTLKPIILFDIEHSMDTYVKEIKWRRTTRG
jgi:hypothetical protein